MYAFSSFHVILCRRRQRLGLILLHSLLLAFSLIIVLVMIVHAISVPVSIQYFLHGIFLTFIATVSIFALIVYCHCRFLLRILSILASFSLLLIGLVFISSYLQIIRCRYDDNNDYIVRINTSRVCNDAKTHSHINQIHDDGFFHLEDRRVQNKSTTESVRCVYRYKYKDPCPALPMFWLTSSDNDVESDRDHDIESDEDGARYALKPVAVFYGFLTIVVMMITLWHSVDEVRFGRSMCANCGCYAGPVAHFCQ